MYHFNPEQQAALLAELREIGSRILAINFEDPAQDHQNIRHHAYLKGKLAILTELLEDKQIESEKS